ncbi:MAG: asparagine synthase (glutamine-hydrolyzing) [Candidatus Omnitrophica bacterium]|nr:asparagine synthase (glutamine-hydrolyzing) [Candidatus Omnitrophota bacterium]HPB68521.1 asparagine synthase (glutamine-hydrolyzing) [Candidatus Omnitrophota bacterium]HQP11134.1 asparagine synthase (glutamine-hydrolyzing) [Candidatus Omnitrophota bacterium]
MCGINGIFGLPDAQEHVKAMNQTLRHRGPDAQGLWQDGRLALGHQRLAIIDLSEKANQPMEKDGLVIVYNGEIYNYRELRSALERRGVRFQTDSDTEVVLELFRCHRQNSFAMLQGMFAFGLLDRPKNELYLARDYFGIKPLFYSRGIPGCFIFSSELKAFLGLPGFRKEVSPSVLVSCLNYLWPSGNESIFKDVYKVPPAHFLKVRLAAGDVSLSQHRYWELPGGPPAVLPEKKLIEDLRRVMKESVDRHLVSDVPVGAFLSGGLDSSYITALAKQGTPDLSTFTITVSRRDQRVERMPADNIYAADIARVLGVRHTDIPVTPSVVDSLQDMVAILDEPIGDPAAINTYLICQCARQRGLKVLLSGMGADEIFAGYRRHYATLLSQQVRRWPGPVKAACSAVLSGMPVRLGRWGLRPVRWAKRFFSFTDMPWGEAYMRSYSYYGRLELCDLFNRQFDSQVDALFAQHDELFYHHPDWDDINRMCFTDIHMFMTGLNLTYTDQASMAASVEVRVPFIDKTVVEWAMALPGRFKIKDRTAKYLLKKAAEEVLPKRIVYRPKASFGMPLRAWMAGDLRELVDDVLSYGNIKKRGLLNPEKVRALIDADRCGREDNAYRIYQFLTCELWMRRFLDS